MTLDPQPQAIPTSKASPMMLQWQACKASCPEALLLFRLGDFYEAFEQDAALLSKELDVILTQRQGIPMAGIPAHAAEGYIEKLVARGRRVAIAEQTEDPKAAKGLVKREVIRVITPGSLMSSSQLLDKAANYLASLSKIGPSYALGFLDLSTGECRFRTCGSVGEVRDVLASLRPKELIAPEKLRDIAPEITFTKEASIFELGFATDLLQDHFKVAHLDGLGLRGEEAAISALGALFSYVLHDLRLSLTQVQSLKKEDACDFMAIDCATMRHLEIVSPLHDEGISLLTHLDRTVTPMGGRRLKEWLMHPLLSVEKIRERQKLIHQFLRAPEISLNLRQQLKAVRDLERLVTRIETGFATPKDLASLRNSLAPLPLLSYGAESLGMAQMPNLDALFTLLKKALVESPPSKVSEGGIFALGFHPELDELRRLKSESQGWISAYQEKLRGETGIKTLKVGYTAAFGYYIEVGRGKAEAAPPSFERKQTLVNAERFITSELKAFEHQVLTSEEQSLALEEALFSEIKGRIIQESPLIRTLASQIATLDALLSFAECARLYRYTCPEVTEEGPFLIEEGRHPVIEASLPAGSFIPNSTHFDEGSHLFLITGPNMAGKSTYMRQVALLALLAQVGSFLPARRARLPLVDKLFSRIGASDDLTRGQSTFMVEMAETANILRHATPKSLILLDEIGRGTSTYDGIAIAWAVAEYLLTTPDKRAKTLFATHYLELTKLAEKFPGAVNYTVSVLESEQGVVFLHKIVRGAADKSYGIHVAKLAGLPGEVVRLAEEQLKLLPCPL